MTNLQRRVKIVQCFSISSRELHSARAAVGDMASKSGGARDRSIFGNHFARLFRCKITPAAVVCVYIYIYIYITHTHTRGCARSTHHHRVRHTPLWVFSKLLLRISAVYMHMTSTLPFVIFANLLYIYIWGGGGGGISHHVSDVVAHQQWIFSHFEANFIWCRFLGTAVIPKFQRCALLWRKPW